MDTVHFMNTLDVTTGSHSKASIKPAHTTSAMPESTAMASKLSPRDPVSMGTRELLGINKAWLSSRCLRTPTLPETLDTHLTGSTGINE